jgi:hypothetical protein
MAYGIIRNVMTMNNHFDTGITCSMWICVSEGVAMHNEHC